MFDIKDAIITERVFFGDGRSTIRYTFKCGVVECSNLCFVQRQHLKKSKGKCRVCVQHNKPFESMYNELSRAVRNKTIGVSLSYEEFLEFTKQSECTYCRKTINWNPYTRDIKTHKYLSRSYNLDRKDNKIGYTKDNCVVCCWSCNQMKSNEFSFEEFMLLSDGLRKIVQNRK